MVRRLSGVRHRTSYAGNGVAMATNLPMLADWLAAIDRHAATDDMDVVIAAAIHDEDYDYLDQLSPEGVEETKHRLVSLGFFRVIAEVPSSRPGCTAEQLLRPSLPTPEVTT